MRLLSDNISNTSSTPTTGHVINDYSKLMTWRDHLMENSVEQIINGNDVERRRSTKTLKKMEVYFERYDTAL